MTVKQDPREIITQDAFSVAPDLLGTPLARPWRRGVAMMMDLLAIVILGSAGWFFLGLGIAFAFFRAALRPARDMVGRGARLATYGSLGALALVITLAATFFNPFSGEDTPVEIGTGESVVNLGLGQAGAAVADVIALTRADSEQEMREAATSFAERMKSQGLAPEEIEEALEEIAAGSDEPWATDAVRAGLAAADIQAQPGTGEAVDADSLALAYAAALQAGDTVAMSRMREPLGQTLAADRLTRQDRQIERLQSENAGLESDLEAERDRGLIRMMFNIADEIGIGFGWAGLYFTMFLAFWGGRTPGKRAMGIQVVRLDGKPIGLWASFNRFGGYAASIFTGLLGFFEMFWDANRQALHDRIASTVVIRERGGR